MPGKKQVDEKNENLSEKKSKKEKNVTKSIFLRIVMKLLKILLVWCPLILIILISIVLITAKLFLTPARVESLITSNFNDNANGQISLNVKKFSPYSGFVIENVKIKNSKEFNNTDFIKIDKLVLKYGFFSLFIGNIHFDEIGIYKPRIYIAEKNGVWNYNTLMKETKEVKPVVKTTTEDKIDEEDKEDKTEKPLSEINLPIAIDILFNFILNDLHFYLNGEKMKTSIKGISFLTNIKVPDFDKIPLSLDALKLLEKLHVELNPKEEIDFAFYSQDAELKPPLILSWKLLYENKQNTTMKIDSKFKFGTYNAPVRFKNIHLAPLNFLIKYDLFYNPEKDLLTLNDFAIIFKNKKWFNLSGNIKKVTTKQNMNIYMKDSEINLNDIYPYYLSFTNDKRTKFSGLLSFKPLSIKGSIDHLDVNGKISFSKLIFRSPAIGGWVPRFDFGYSAIMRKNNLKFISKIEMQNFSYQLGRDLSGENGLELNVNIDAFNYKRFVLNEVDLRLYDPITRKSAVNILVDGDVSTSPNLKGKININKLKFNKNPLLNMLSAKFKKQVESIPLKKPIKAILSTNFNLAKKTNADLKLSLKVPDYDVTDLNLAVGITSDSNFKNIKIRKCSLRSKKKGLSLKVNGFVDRSKDPIADSDIKLSLKVDYPKMQMVYAPWQLSGKINISARVKGDLETGFANGNFIINNFNLINNESKLAVEELNLNFPFNYKFAYRTNHEESKIAVDKSRLITNKEFIEEDNFKITAIKIKHPARKEQITIMKNFGSVMFFRNNTFEIPKLKASILDGSLYGRDILFYLSDMKKDNYQYKLKLDITNIDVGKLDNVDPSQKKRDAEISMNVDVSGQGLDFSKELSTNGSINIYKIGKKFANKLLKGLSEEKGKSVLGGIGQFAVDNTTEPKGFYYYMDEGNIYTTVKLKKVGVGGLFLGIENEEVKFDRMPIQEYVKGIFKEN